MTIRRRCTERNCKNGRKCLEHLRFDVMFRGKRYRIPANEFAIPRMETGKQREIQSMEEARDWERLFIGEIKAGRNPRRPSARTMQPAASCATSRRSSTLTSSVALNRQAFAASRPFGAALACSKSISENCRCRRSKTLTRSTSSRPTRSTPKTSRSRRCTAFSKHCGRP